MVRGDLCATLAVAGVFAVALDLQSCLGQTTQGLIAGKVFDAGTKNPIPDATVEYLRREQGDVVETRSVHTNGQGFYAFPFVPPGLYQLRVCEGHCASLRKGAPATSEYQPQEIYEVELFVASRLEVNFALRKLTNAWKIGIQEGLYEDSTTAVIHFYAADVSQLRSAYLQLVPARASPLEATVSYVIDPQSVENLPLSGRDIYSTLVLQPAVTSSSATTRGLGLSANGQRPTSSNFLLDGVENNNYFQTGPLTPISPEAMQEYRASTSNYSAQYGRTSGFLANAVTRSGTNSYHGLLFGYVGNELLNANSFQNNARVPYKQLHAGYAIGGPILRNRLFFFSEFEQFRSRSQKSAESACLPVASDIEALNEALHRGPDGNIGSPLLARFPIAATFTGLDCYSQCLCFPYRYLRGNVYRWLPTVSVDRSLALERFDYHSPNVADRFMGRVILSRASRPDFVTSPYEGLNSRLSEDSTGIALGYTHNFRPNVTNELRLGWTNYDLHWNRPAPDVPTLYNVSEGPLPGSSLPFSFRNRENDWELADNLSLIRGRHIVTAGGGLLIRRPHSLLTLERDGALYFYNTFDFGGGFPLLATAAVRRLPNDSLIPPYVEPTFSRTYSNQQFNFFLQDTWRLNSRLTLNAGLRFESFGALKNIGLQDVYWEEPGPGNSVVDRYSKARPAYDPNHQRSSYSPDRNGWSPRIGMSYLLRNMLLHAAYGIYYDRPFDNLIENTRLNGMGIAEGTTESMGFTSTAAFSLRGLSPLQLINKYGLNKYEANVTPTILPLIISEKRVVIDPNFRNARVQSWFAGIQRPLSSNVTLEINYLGSSGRRLLTSDQLDAPEEFIKAPIYSVGSIYTYTYIGNQGLSSYHALASVLRYRARSAQLQLAYTLSHSIDVQSDSLLGGLDLGSATISGSGSSGSIGSSCAGYPDLRKVPQRYYNDCLNPSHFANFSTQGSPLQDRGNSDFDQRHNLIFTFLWQLPAPQTSSWIRSVLRGWQTAGLGAFRSGFPVNVTYTPDSSFQVPLPRQQRPNLTGAPVKNVNVTSQDRRGGLMLLNRSAFSYPRLFGPSPPAGTQLGRNAIAGPGFWNVDLSLARSFHLLGSETRILQFRADFFNVFNHANLGAPDGDLTGRTFGQSFYGQTAPSAGLTSIIPLAAEQRQVQLQLKFFF